MLQEKNEARKQRMDITERKLDDIRVNILRGFIDEVMTEIHEREKKRGRTIYMVIYNVRESKWNNSKRK